MKLEQIEQLQKVWNLGWNLIPVRDADGTPKEKKPFEDWKGVPRLEEVELIDKMFKYRTDSVAVKCGVESGGLVCIDIDTKAYKGIDKTIFESITGWHEKFRIEKTPSGGWHLYFYLLNAGMVINGGVAKRIKTESEIKVEYEKKLLESKKEVKIENIAKTRDFIEVKYTGGLCQCFPSPGYVIKKEDIGSLEWNEWEELLGVLKSYNEVVPIEYIKGASSGKVGGVSSDYYLIKPGDDFDASEAGGMVLEEAGWTFYKQSGIWNQYIKPGGKRGQVGAVFNTVERWYRIFTTDSSVDDKAFKPSSLICQFNHNGIWSECIAWMIASGYGKIKPELEKRLIKKAVLSGGVLPQGISPLGVENFKKMKEDLDEKYPHGKFWFQGEKGVEISREDFYLVAEKLGWFLYRDGIIRVTEVDGSNWTGGSGCIEFVEERDFFDGVKDYICQGFDSICDGSEELGGRKYLVEEIEILNGYESYLQHSGKFTISRLGVLSRDKVFECTKYRSYKFFKNCWLLITKDGFEEKSYDELPGLIFKADIRNRNWVIVGGCFETLYGQFINNAIGWTTYLKKVIGFYAHDYRDQDSYWCIAIEKGEGGGTGKNIFWNLFKEITTCLPKTASMVKFDNTALQSWKYQRIFVFSDMEKDFKLATFKDMVAGDEGTIRKLYKDEANINVRDMPKIGGSSNHMFSTDDAGLLRRIKNIEFTDYYKGGGVNTKHDGKMFPLDWSYDDYTGFDNCMINCIIEFLKGGNKIESGILSDKGWEKKFNEQYKNTADFIRSGIEDWISIGRVSNDYFNNRYSEFRIEYGIMDKYKSSPQVLNKALREWCGRNGIGIACGNEENKEVANKGLWKDRDGKLVRGRCFWSGGEVEEVDEDLPF